MTESRLLHVSLQRVCMSFLLFVFRFICLSIALHGNLEVVKILHERCTYDVNSADSCGVCPLMDAARGNHMGVVTYLVEVWRADSFSADILGRRALHHASQSGAGLVIRYLVAAGADVNEPVSVNAITPLHYAAKVRRRQSYSCWVMLLLLLVKNFKTQKVFTCDRGFSYFEAMYYFIQLILALKIIVHVWTI